LEGGFEVLLPDDAARAHPIANVEKIRRVAVRRILDQVQRST
jgi:hypothetical protein